MGTWSPGRTYGWNLEPGVQLWWEPGARGDESIARWRTIGDADKPLTVVSSSWFTTDATDKSLGVDVQFLSPTSALVARCPTKNHDDDHAIDVLTLHCNTQCLLCL